jgi:hypothetical protein
MAGTGLPEVDALAWAEQGLAAFRIWTRRQALARDAPPEAVQEFVKKTARLLELDQTYWRCVARTNAALVEQQRGRLSTRERHVITVRLLSPFQAAYRECEARLQPLLARLPEILQHPENTMCRRDWVQSVDAAVSAYSYALLDTLETLRAAERAATALSEEVTTAASLDEDHQG